MGSNPYYHLTPVANLSAKCTELEFFLLSADRLEDISLKLIILKKKIVERNGATICSLIE